MSLEKGKPIELSTYLAWDDSITSCLRTKEEFKPERNKVYVTHINCEVCARNSDSIKMHPSCRGKAKRDMLAYVIGTDYISKYNLKSHIQGKAHKIALSNDVQSHATASTSTSSTSPHAVSQPRIDQALSTAAKDAYSKLFNTAYNIIIRGKPQKDFEYIVQIQKENGVRLLKGKQTNKLCTEMVTYISDVIKEEIAELLISTTAFSILNDGSQPKKTGSEMELVYVRVLKNGLPTYYCVGLQELAEHGGGTAISIKQAIDDVFINKLKIPNDQYRDKCVGVTADGAAVNTGQYTGVFSQMGQTRSWLLSFHCVAHRAELSAKDAFDSSTDFNDIVKFYEANYKLLKNSGKLKSELKASCEALGITFYTMPKIHGTRFLHHKHLGLERLLHMWIPLRVTYENAISSPRGYTSDTRAKMTGFIKKLERYDFLAAVCTFKAILESLSVLSLMFEREYIFSFEVLPNLKRTEELLKDLKESTPSLNEFIEPYFDNLFESENSDGTTHKLKKVYCKAGHERNDKQNREFVTLNLNVKNVDNASNRVVKIKHEVIPKLLSSFTKRFSSFDSSILQQMGCFDPQNWDMHGREFVSKYGIEHLLYLEKHFATTLQLSNYNSKSMLKEWKKFKIMVKTSYPTQKCSALWELVFKYKVAEFPNICKLAQIVLCLPVSNCSVERGFSFLTHTLSYRRLSLKYGNLEDYIIIRNNHMVWNLKARKSASMTTLGLFLNIPD